MPQNVTLLLNQFIIVLLIYFQGLDAHKYKNTIDCAVKIFKNEGLRAKPQSMAHYTTNAVKLI
jgi:hypothetical protein